jgi:hypothetical protein
LQMQGVLKLKASSGLQIEDVLKLKASSGLQIQQLFIQEPKN